MHGVAWTTPTRAADGAGGFTTSSTDLGSRLADARILPTARAAAYGGDPALRLVELRHRVLDGLRAGVSRCTITWADGRPNTVGQLVEVTRDERYGDWIQAIVREIGPGSAAV